MLWRCALSWLAVMLCSAVEASATLYQVGPGRTYDTLQDVEDLLEPGDLVEVDGDETYPGGVWFQEDGSEGEPIVIRGIRVNGNRPHLAGGNNTVELQGDWYVFEGFEVTGGTSRCIYHHAANIVIRDVVVHDCAAHGILGADEDSGSLTLEYCEVYACGNGGSQHQIYMATDEWNNPGSVFRMQYCYIHDGNGGNNVKSRAERNEIYYNWIEGAAIHQLELIGPDLDGDPEEYTPELVREDSDVVGNVLWTKNATFAVTRSGGDGTGETFGRYRFVNNTILTNSEGAVFRLHFGVDSIEMHNNVILRTGTGAPRIMRAEAADPMYWLAGVKITGTNNWVETGSTFVPGAGQWTGTITGVDPMFANLAAGDLRPLSDSPLVGAANPSPSSPAGYEIVSPHFPPIRHPPLGMFVAVGAAETRPVVGVLDIGAFEYENPALFEDGFESETTSAWSVSAPP